MRSTGGDFVWPTALGATLSEKNAQKEFGLSHGEIVKAIKSGKLRYLINYAHGNPYVKLVRKEVEALVRGIHGDHYLDYSKLETELRKLKTDLSSLRRKKALLEKRQAELMRLLGKSE